MIIAKISDNSYSNNPIKTSVLIGAALGTVVEYYDLALIAIFLPIFSPLFFPSDTPYHSLMKGYVILWIALIMRPLGGLFFGYFGDKFSRCQPLLYSIWGIVISTFIIGLLPSSKIIGVWAAIVLVAIRGFQQFCFGGDYNGAGIYIVEHAAKKNEILAGCVFVSTVFIGALIASLVGVMVTSPAMPKESWRLAFIVGGLIGMIGIGYRIKMPESPLFESSSSAKSDNLTMLKLYPLELVTSIFIGGLVSVPFNSIFMFINPVLMANGYFTQQQLMLTQTFLIIIAIISLVVAGLLANLTPPVKWIKACCTILIVFSYPLLSIVDRGCVFHLLAAVAGIVMLTEFLHGPSHAYFKNTFDIRYRYRASSLGFGLGVSVLGSITPIVDKYLYQWSGNKFSSGALWIIVVAMSALVCIIILDKKQKEKLKFRLNQLKK